MAITIIEKNSTMFHEVFVNARTAYLHGPFQLGPFQLGIEWVRSELRERILRDPKVQLEDSGESRFTILDGPDSFICIYSHVTRKKIVTPQVPTRGSHDLDPDQAQGRPEPAAGRTLQRRRPPDLRDRLRLRRLPDRGVSGESRVSGFLLKSDRI